MSKLNQFVRKYTFILFMAMLATATVVVGCSAENDSEDKNISTLKTVLNETYTVPNKELRDILEDPSNFTVIGAEEKTSLSNNLDAYLEKKYQPYFTEEMYDKYIGTYALSYVAPSPGNSVMKIKDVEVEQTEKMQNIYDFTAIIDYKKVEGSKVEKYEVKGQVDFSENGKIAEFIIRTDSNLSIDIRNN